MGIMFLSNILNTLVKENCVWLCWCVFSPLYPIAMCSWVALNCEFQLVTIVKLHLRSIKHKFHWTCDMRVVIGNPFSHNFQGPTHVFLMFRIDKFFPNERWCKNSIHESKFEFVAQNPLSNMLLYVLPKHTFQGDEWQF